MKVAKLRTKLVEIPLSAESGSGYAKQRAMGCVLIFLDSDQGLVGEGLISSLNSRRLKVFSQIVESFGEFVVGLDPTRYGAFLERAFADVRSNGAQGMAALGVAGVEMALWDLRAKLAQTNVANLLGRRHESLPVYHSGGLWVDRTVDELQTMAASHVSRGFKAMKIRLRGDAAADVARVRAVREAVGAGVTLHADANQRMSPPQAIRLGRELEEFQLAWIEDPTPSHDIAGSAAVAAALDTPIASGENASLIRDANDLLRARAVDVLMVDLQRIGGPSEFMKSAHLAEAACAPFSSHLFSEMSLALLAGAANAMCLEYMPWHSPIYHEQITLDERGRALVSDRPGWGFAFDEEAIRRYALA